MGCDRAVHNQAASPPPCVFNIMLKSYGINYWGASPKEMEKSGIKIYMEINSSSVHACLRAPASPGRHHCGTPRREQAERFCRGTRRP